MTPTKQHELLMDLVRVLRSFCHAPGCETLRRCPHQCSCRNRRTFKTNNETAICWELANNIFNYLRGERKLARHKITLETQAVAYMHLSYYHMTKGWSSLYQSAFQIIRMVLNQNKDYNLEDSISHRFMEMRRVINKLKRDAKG